MRLKGTIRRYENGFGFANHYDEQGKLERFFVHKNNQDPQAPDFDLELDLRISFEPGEPRRPGERRVALNMRMLNDDGTEVKLGERGERTIPVGYPTISFPRPIRKIEGDGGAQ